MTATGCVQDCGCIALPEEVQAKTGLYPGARFQLELLEDGNLLLTPLEPGWATISHPGVQCG